MQVLEKYFDTAFDAPDGIKKLRELILTLAMQGKLVLQDQNDQPASELLKKLKKIKNIPTVNSNEMSFSLPQNWEWERIVNLGITQTGTTPPKKDPEYYGDFIPFIGPGNIKNGVIDYSGEGLSEKGIEKGRLIEKDSILMVCIGGSIGKHAMTNQDISCNQQINTITVYPELSTQYVYWAMASQYFQNIVIKQAGGSATPIINKLKWSSIPIPVPPYNEQQRIVEKINQLMALCDELEKLKEQKEVKKLTVHKSAINQLLDSKDASNSQKGWHFISEHFNDLYTVKENVSELRSAILQLAMQGKLVRQDPNDQPANELLKEIEKEKQQLIKEGKIKKSKPLPLINENEKLFEVPNNWKWVRFNDVLDVRDGTHDTPRYVDVGYPLVTSKNLYTGILDFANVQYISEEDHVKISERSKVNNGDILFAMIGSIGNPVIVDTDIEFSIKNVALFKYYNQNTINSQYLYRYLLFAQEKMKTMSSGAVQKFVSLGFLRSFLFPLPPLNEQKRIVEKINQLMALCDDLEKQIKNSSTKQTELLNAIMSNLGK